MTSIESIHAPSPRIDCYITIDTVRTKHRLLYVEIQMQCLLRDCLQRIVDSQSPEKYESDENCDNVFAQAVACYREFDHVLYRGLASSQAYPTIDRVLGSQLTELFQIRTMLMHSLEIFLSSLAFKELVELLENISHDLVEITSKLKAGKNVPEQVISSWEKLMGLFLEKFVSCLDARNFQSFCGVTYPSILRKAEVCTLYLTWEQFLNLESRKIFEETPHRDSIKAALKIKELLYTSKDLFFKQFFTRAESGAAAPSVCNKWKQKKLTPADILLKLAQKIKKIKRRITVLEKDLLAPISRISDYASTVIRFFTTNTYAKTADFLVSSQDMALRSQQWRHAAVLTTPLTGPYLKLAKGLTATGLLTLDIAQWRLVGISQSMLYSIIQQIMPCADSWTTFFQRLNVDEKTTLLYLPIINRIFECGVFVGLNSYPLGYSMRSLTQISLSYLGATAASYGCGKVVDISYQFAYRGQPIQQIPSYPLVRGLTQWMTFPLVNARLLPYVVKRLDALSMHPQDVLLNKENCFAHVELCKREARKVLGLDENATLQTVKETFRRLAMFYHPDRNGAGAEMFIKMAQAKQYCVDLAHG